MKSFILGVLCLFGSSLGSATHAQETVTASPHADSLFTDSDPKLNTNKQAAYYIIKDLLEAGHWELADKYLTPDYHQHNPLVKSGRDNVVTYFTQVLKVQPKSIPANMETPIVSVVAEGDYVIVAYPRVLAKAGDPSKTYTTTWFDMWRFVDGKADEHWDGATIGN